MVVVIAADHALRHSSILHPCSAVSQLVTLVYHGIPGILSNCIGVLFIYNTRPRPWEFISFIES